MATSNHSGDLAKHIDSLVASASSSDSDPEPEYFFEKVPLVLKNNPDYQQLLKCQLKLHSQVYATVKNLEHLVELWDYGAKQPLLFLEGFKTGKITLPEKIPITELPNINWSKYSPSDGRGHLRSSNIARRSRHSITGRVDTMQHSSSTSSRSELADSAMQEDVKPSEFPIVRGRVCDASKPHSFNLPWTREEQRRLDELLVTFPPEHIAANRYRKIAEELGTRTPIQVQSRLQKYSIALKKNKIALPGYKRPSWNIMRKQMGYSRRRATLWAGESRSTFITSHDNSNDPTTHGEWDNTSCAGPSVKQEHLGQTEADMDEEDATISDDEGSPEQRRLTALRRVRCWIRKEQEPGSSPRHHTFTCCICKQSPIVGIRYNCLDCHYIKQEIGDSNSRAGAGDDPQSPELFSVDLCNRCHKQLQSSHKEGVRSPKSHVHESSHRVRLHHSMHLKETLNRLLLTIEVNDRNTPN